MIVTLSSTAPRSLDKLHNIPLKKGLRIYFFLAYCMFFGGALGFISGILNMLYMDDIKIGLLQTVFGAGLFSLLGYLLIKPARQRLERRRTAFTDGILKEATVTAQGRTFVVWKSGQDWLIKAQVVLENGRRIEGALQTAERNLAKSLTPGTKLQALYIPEQESLFLPLEIGVQVNMTLSK